MNEKWIVSEKGKEVLKKARKISKQTKKIIESDSYLSVLNKHSIPLIENYEGENMSRSDAYSSDRKVQRIGNIKFKKKCRCRVCEPDSGYDVEMLKIEEEKRKSINLIDQYFLEEKKRRKKE